MNTTILKGYMENATFILSNTGHYHLAGNMYQHPHIPDGHFAYTSRVLDIQFNDGLMFVQTNNSVYEVNMLRAQCTPTDVEKVMASIEANAESEVQ